MSVSFPVPIVFPWNSYDSIFVEHTMGKQKTGTMYEYLMQNATHWPPAFLLVPYWAVTLSLRHTCHYMAG